jgi:hypothetical protein
MKYFFLFSLMIMAQACVENPGPASTVFSYAGYVSINGSALTSLKNPVRYGDRIITGGNSFCEILINEKNLLRLGPSSELVFRISGKEAGLELKKGWFAGITRKVFASGGTYTVSTPTVTAGIRGTSYCVKVENPSSTYFCVCNGSIDLKDSSGLNAETVQGLHHSARRFRIGSDGSVIVDRNPGLLYHDDTGLEAMAAAIQERIDWTRPE